jgi:hypothetical protein
MKNKIHKIESLNISITEYNESYEDMLPKTQDGRVCKYELDSSGRFLPTLEAAIIFAIAKGVKQSEYAAAACRLLSVD